MEIGPDGYGWIAGGPRSSPSTTESAADEPGTRLELYAGAVTQVAAAAGPPRWQPRLAALAAKYDLSASLLEAVVWQESRWNSAAVSPVGARGFTQLMPGTARQMGVDPHDPEANLEGGARYLRLQLDAFQGDLEKALAAYNAGPARVERAGGVPKIRETRDYVASILDRLSAPVTK